MRPAAGVIAQANDCMFRAAQECCQQAHYFGVIHKDRWSSLSTGRSLRIYHAVGSTNANNLETVDHSELDSETREVVSGVQEWLYTMRGPTGM